MSETQNVVSVRITIRLGLGQGLGLGLGCHDLAVWQAALDPDAGLTDWRLNLKHSFVAGKNSPQKIDFTKTNQNLQTQN